jgi:hypothetical protein
VRAGKGAPAPENPGRTEQTFDDIATPQGNTSRLEQRAVAGAYGRAIAISTAPTCWLHEIGSERSSVPQQRLTHT